MTFHDYFDIAILVLLAVAVVVVMKRDPQAVAELRSFMKELVDKLHNSVPASAVTVVANAKQDAESAMAHAVGIAAGLAGKAVPAPAQAMKDGYPYVKAADGKWYYVFDGHNFASIAVIEAYKAAVVARDAQQAIIDTTVSPASK